ETGGFTVAKMKVSFSALCDYHVTNEWHTLCGTILNTNTTLPRKQKQNKTQSPMATFRSECTKATGLRTRLQPWGNWKTR
ncbi:hypothetical protein STEG23_028585, partial [Scotinomys teguina]